MTDPISRPRAMTDEQAQQIMDAIKNRGGNITYQDPRLSSFISWAGVIIGCLAVASITWGVSTMQELNLKVGILITQHDNDARRIDDMNDRLKVLEARHDPRN